MNALAFQVLTVLAAVGGPAASENTLLKELVEKGVEMPDKHVVYLPAPTMAEGLNAEQQTAVLAKTAALAPGKPTLEQFLDPSIGPVALILKKIPSKAGNDVIRTVNLHFLVYGDWNVLTSDEFSKTILEKPNNANNNGLVSKAGYLKAPEMAVRRLATRSTPDLKE